MIYKHAHGHNRTSVIVSGLPGATTVAPQGQRSPVREAGIKGSLTLRRHPCRWQGSVLVLRGLLCVLHLGRKTQRGTGSQSR